MLALSLRVPDWSKAAVELRWGPRPRVGCGVRRRLLVQEVWGRGCEKPAVTKGSGWRLLCSLPSPPAPCQAAALARADVALDSPTMGRGG